MHFKGATRTEPIHETGDYRALCSLTILVFLKHLISVLMWPLIDIGDWRPYARSELRGMILLELLWKMQSIQ